MAESNPGTGLAPNEPQEITQHETASSAAAAKAQALVQARYLVAMRNPRDWMDVREKLHKACQRPGFAKTARYSVPRGGASVKGFTIRFAEEAIRSMGNLYPETTILYEDDEKRIVNVSLMDLEANVTFAADVVVYKRIERKKLQQGQVPVATRINSKGETLYILEASDDDLLPKMNALASKALRTHTLRLLPGDIQEECVAWVMKTLTQEDAKDPQAAIKQLADSFAGLGIKPSDLKAYLGVELSACSPVQRQHLREVYAAIRDGEVTWREVLAEVPGAGEEKHASVKDKVAKAAGKNGGKATAAKEPTPAAVPPKDTGEFHEDPPQTNEPPLFPDQ